MPLTVAAAVAEVVGRVSGKLAAANLPTAADGTNAPAVAAVRKALGYLARSPASPTALLDSDLTTITGPAAEKLFDAATLELLYAVLGNLDGVDESIGDSSQKLSQLATQVESLIAALQSRLSKPYGPNVPRGSVGVAPGAGVPNDPFDPCRTRSNPPGAWPYPR